MNGMTAAAKTTNATVGRGQPPYTGLVCPKCSAPKAVILPPDSDEATVLTFRCAACGFEWVSLNQRIRKTTKKR